MSINQKLRELYGSKWQGLTTAMESILQDAAEELPASPLLLKIQDEDKYNNSEIKLVIFGQETNRWYESFHGDIDAILGYYDTFFNSGNYKSYGGQFWNGVARFTSMLQERYPAKTVSLVWNNLVKIGKDTGVGFPSNKVHTVERNEFNVIPNELSVLQPTITLFFTGPQPNYAEAFNEVFNNPELIPISKDFSVRQLATTIIPNTGQAFRTYHPGFLWRNGIDNYFKAIIDRIELP